MPKRFETSALPVLLAILCGTASCTPLSKPYPAAEADVDEAGEEVEADDTPSLGPREKDAGPKRPVDASPASGKQPDASTPPQTEPDPTPADAAPEAGADASSAAVIDARAPVSMPTTPVTTPEPPEPSVPVECPASACTPGGTCSVAGNDFTCTCARGYMGTGTKSCRKIEYCRAGICGAGGTCVEGADDYSCTCSAGYSGTGTQRCTKITYCKSGVCDPGGVCLEEATDFRCSCELKSPDAKSCPYLLRDDGIYDKTTNLTWKTGYGPYYMHATPEDALAFCAMSPGWRWATLQEVMKIPIAAFSPPQLCFFTPSGRYCPPGADPNAETFKVHCVR